MLVGVQPIATKQSPAPSSEQAEPATPKKKLLAVPFVGPFFDPPCAFKCVARVGFRRQLGCRFSVPYLGPISCTKTLPPTKQFVRSYLLSCVLHQEVLADFQFARFEEPPSPP
jgi:hypothetical protein